MNKTAKKNTATATKPTVGRPRLTFKLPANGEFTANTLLGRLHKNPPTRVTVLNHIKLALAAGEIVQVGTRSEGRGRPMFVFKSKSSK